MITSNTSIQFTKAESSENKFYLSRLTSEYNEGDAITTSTAINCRKLAIAIKAGDKITINGTSLTVYADAAVDATSFFVEEITLDEALNINANIAIDEDNMFVQYQRKSEGTVAGFDIDADGMSKGGVEITGWLDSDTMEGATENNIPTAQSVKAYVDGQAGHSETLQEVTDNGNITDNSILIKNNGNANLSLSKEDNDQKLELIGGNGGVQMIKSSYDLAFYKGGNEKMRLTSTGLGIGTTSPASILEINGGSADGVKIIAANAGTEFVLNASTSNGTSRLWVGGTGNVGIGTTSPASLLHVAGTVQVGVDDTGHDVKFFGATAGKYLLWDESADALKFTDSTQLILGTGNDLIIQHASNNSYINSFVGDLYIKQQADDKDIIFQCDDGSGGTTAYLTLDGSQETVNVYKNLLIGTTTDSGGRLKSFSANGGDMSLILGRADTNNFWKFNHAGNDLRIYNEAASGSNIILGVDNGGNAEANNVLIGTPTDSGYKLDVNGTQRVQDVLELEDVLTLNAISTPDDPENGKSSIYMDSSSGDIKVKINFGEEGVVTRTIASFEG